MINGLRVEVELTLGRSQSSYSHHHTTHVTVALRIHRDLQSAGPAARRCSSGDGDRAGSPAQGPSPGRGIRGIQGDNSGATRTPVRGDAGGKRYRAADSPVATKADAVSGSAR